MPLRVLCLHGWGTSEKILQTQLCALMSDLQRDNTAVFHFVEGQVESEAGPGISGVYDGPYWSYYRFPLSFVDTDESLLDAYELLYDVVQRDGPFDAILGFSHGGTLASGFLIHHAKMYPHEPPLFRCAIFINSLPPFRMHSGGKPVIEPGLEGYISIPTISVVGARDFLFPYSIALHDLCEPSKSCLVIHSKGHDIPTDRKNVGLIANAIRKLALDVWAC